MYYIKRQPPHKVVICAGRFVVVIMDTTYFLLACAYYIIRIVQCQYTFSAAHGNQLSLKEK